MSSSHLTLGRGELSLLGDAETTWIITDGDKKRQVRCMCFCCFFDKKNGCKKFPLIYYLRNKKQWLKTMDSNKSL